MINTDFRVSVIQLECKLNAKQRNIKRALDYIDIEAAKGTKLICLPEGFVTSSNLTALDVIAECVPGEITEVLCAKAKEHKIYIAGGLFEKDESGYYSTSILVCPEGNIKGRYRRIHTHQLEKKFICSGSDSVVIETELGRIGLINGYDIFYPESCRSLFRKKADILVCSALIPADYAYSARHLAVSRAIENHCYFIFASGAGRNQFTNFDYMGSSLIAGDPISIESAKFDFVYGDEILCSAGIKETVISANINIQAISGNLKWHSLYEDFREDLFKYQ